MISSCVRVGGNRRSGSSDEASTGESKRTITRLGIATTAGSFW